ncbi:hypothetical protein YDYSG_52970 [Paenibacillus tyrfis]|uniref:hypothetical protein n=1 Tax=Paenibacillus tyrfis TaxID=1501230 RepID=UPI00249170A7|nr:hypothetical protein [Paenibacillus tyrfis]GLI09265.1 hypothetical protein YDYSG_52970 [Paenibacillus tyrfis]
MGETTKIAISAAIQAGGSLFTPEQLAKISAAVGADAKIEMTTFKQLYAEVPLERRDAIKEDLERYGLEVYPAGALKTPNLSIRYTELDQRAGFADYWIDSDTERRCNGSGNWPCKAAFGWLNDFQSE